LEIRPAADLKAGGQALFNLFLMKFPAKFVSYGAISKTAAPQPEWREAEDVAH